MPPQGCLLDGHVLGKWWKICPRDSAYALRNKNLHCFRACLRMPTRTVKYQVLSLRGFLRSSLEYIMLVIQKKTMLIWGGKGRKGGRPLNVAIEMWRRQNACSDRSPSAPHTANTTEISTLPSGPFIVDHAIEFSKPPVRMHYTALYNADNGVEPRTSTTAIM